MESKEIFTLECELADLVSSLMVVKEPFQEAVLLCLRERLDKKEYMIIAEVIWDSCPAHMDNEAK